MEKNTEISFWDGAVTIFMILAVFAAAIFIEIVLLSPIVAQLPDDALLRGMTWVGGMSSAVGITLLLIYKLVGVKSERQSQILWFALILEIAILAVNGVAAFAVYRNMVGEFVDFLKLLGPVNAVVTILAVSIVVGSDPQRKSEFMSREWKLNLKQQLIDGRKSVLKSDAVNAIVWDTTVTEVLQEVEAQTGVRIPRQAIESILKFQGIQKGVGVPKQPTPPQLPTNQLSPELTDALIKLAAQAQQNGGGLHPKP